MSPTVRWVILGIVCICILVYLSYLYWPAGEGGEPFDSPPATLDGTLRPCAVYYTKNVDICDRPNFISMGEEDTLEGAVDRDAINYYSIGKTDVRNQHDRLNAVPTETRTVTQTTALENLKRVLADIDSFPFKNTCKLDMVNLQETQAHPYKINAAGEGTERRGNAVHWSFCYYPKAADTTPGAVNRIQPATRADPRFTRVFQDSQMEYRSASTGATLQRYDMKSMYNDDLINLHCFLYSESVKEAGGSISAFQGTRFMECILDRSEVMSGTSKTMRLVKIRPVKIHNGTLVADTVKKDAYLSLFELIRTQDSLMHRLKSYPITVYKLMFHLCSATATSIEGSDTMPELVHDKYIQLAIPKPMKRQGSAVPLLSFKPNYEPKLTVYNFMTQRPNGDISDMTFDLAKLDRDITSYA